jgi:hypothetical protein
LFKKNKLVDFSRCSPGASQEGMEALPGKFAEKLSMLHTVRTYDVLHTRPLAMTRHLGN